MIKTSKSFLRHEDLEQGTAAWHDWRSQVIGSSDAPVIMRENPWKSINALLDEKLGLRERFKGNALTRRGSVLEPEARKLYESIKGVRVLPSVLQSAARPWQAASVDGIDSQDKVIVEIKCGVKSYQYTASTGEVSPYYYGQLQHILAVSGFSSIDYFCYTPGNKEILLNICRDDAYIKRLIVAETNFCNLLVERGAKIFGIEKNGNDYSSSKRVKKITYPRPSGDEYVGDFVEGKQTGKGTYTWPDGTEYVGDFVEGKQTGRGAKTWPSGGEYVGDFVDDKLTGKGTHTWPDGTEYVGDFVDGKLTGKGTYTWPSGDEYVGDFVEGKRTGKGTYTWPSGAEYVGDFVDGKRTGKGTYTWPSGDEYVGDFVEGKRTGKGTYTWPDGTEYVGDFVEGKQTGRGAKTWPSGAEYVGDFVDGKLTGKGTYTWPDGTEYIGDFVEGKQTGRGAKTWPSGGEYLGDFVDDKLTGKGTHTWDSGIQYIGSFLEGVMEGKGICIELDGTKHEGTWKSDISIDLQEKFLKSAEKNYFKIKEKMYLFRKKWFFEKKLWEQYFSEKKIISAEKKCRLMEKKLDHLLAEYDCQVEFGPENFLHTYEDLIPCIGSIESVEKTWNRLIREGAQCRDVLMAEYLEANEFLATCHSDLMSESKVDEF